MTSTSDVELQGERWLELDDDASAIVALVEVDSKGRVVRAVRVMKLRSPSQLDPVSAFDIRYVGNDQFVVSVIARVAAEIVTEDGAVVVLDAKADGAVLPFKAVVMSVDSAGRVAWFIHSQEVIPETRLGPDGSLVWWHYVSDLGGHVVDASGSVFVPGFGGVPTPSGHGVFMRFDAQGLVRDFAGVSTNRQLLIAAGDELDAFCVELDSPGTPLFVTTSAEVRELESPGVSGTACVAFDESADISWTTSISGATPRSLSASPTTGRFVLHLLPSLSSVKITHTGGVSDVFVDATARDRYGLVILDDLGVLVGTQEVPEGSAATGFVEDDVLVYGACVGDYSPVGSTDSIECGLGSLFVARMGPSLDPIWHLRVLHPFSAEAPMPAGIPFQVWSASDGGIVTLMTISGHEGWFGPRVGEHYFDSLSDTLYLLAEINSRRGIDCGVRP